MRPDMGLYPQAGTLATTPLARGGVLPRSAPGITLQRLHPRDPVCTKWQLGEGLPPATEQLWQQHDAAHPGDTAAPAGGQLRLSAAELHEPGIPWECFIPFAELAREGGLVVGRCPHAADIELPHKTVSRRHALLEIAEKGLVITDLDSTNGTYVDELELSPYDRRHPLTDGVDISLGDANLKLEYIRRPRYFLY